MHQTSGLCAGLCAYDPIHQMKKTAEDVFFEMQIIFYRECSVHLRVSLIFRIGIFLLSCKYLRAERCTYSYNIQVLNLFCKAC